MYKTLALAALAGAVSAQWTQTIIPTVDIAMNGFSYYKFDLTLTADAGYQTMYNPKNVGPSWSLPKGNSETYTFNIFATTTLTYKHEIAQNYKAIYDFNFDLLDVTPYGQTIHWTRPESGSALQVMGNGFREVQVANLHTIVSELATTCSWSAYNHGVNGNFAPVCGYNEKVWTKYSDPYWQFNAGQKLFDAVNMAAYYGPTNYYNF